MSALKCIIAGFIAGAIASVTAHEFISWLFVNYWTGWDAQPWSMEQTQSLLLPSVELPWVVGNAITGGIWGAVFGLFLGWKPHGRLTFRGAVLGLLGPGLVGALTVMPFLAQRPSALFEGNVSELVPILCIAAGFGAITAWLYGLFSFCRLP